ncbi:hypothetical protein [Chryseosolibacter indicus]|uniref:Uncharacterized protein n=1 Tax=Chryseosolibacter indicus TaxID=2782351 RepID=A0ABS5W010_9BACT|nr:hypothetical protein [Chryseosolibacter indicus]MBT1706447.1 hypothetical protein [Chryseosolibacter indicus]
MNQDFSSVAFFELWSNNYQIPNRIALKCLENDWRVASVTLRQERFDRRIREFNRRHFPGTLIGD